MLILAKDSAPLVTLPPSCPSMSVLSLMTPANSLIGKRVPAAATVIPIMSLLNPAPALLRSRQLSLPSLSASDSAETPFPATPIADPNGSIAFLKVSTPRSTAAIPVPLEPPPAPTPAPPPPEDDCLPIALDKAVMSASVRLRSAIIFS